MFGLLYFTHMRQSSNHRAGTGRNQNAKLHIDADALTKSLNAKTLERIARWESIVVELGDKESNERKVEFLIDAINRAKALMC